MTSISEEDADKFVVPAELAVEEDLTKSDNEQIAEAILEASEPFEPEPEPVGRTPVVEPSSVPIVETPTDSDSESKWEEVVQAVDEPSVPTPAPEVEEVDESPAVEENAPKTPGSNLLSAYQEQVAKLSEMGFSNVKRVKELLEEKNGDVIAVVGALLSEST